MKTRNPNLAPPWQKGQSGNPKGRPKVGETLAEQVRAALGVEDPATKKTRLAVVIERAIADAIDGDPTARAWLADRGYGKAEQPITGGDGAPMEIILSWGNGIDKAGDDAASANPAPESA